MSIIDRIRELFGRKQSGAEVAPAAGIGAVVTSDDESGAAPQTDGGGWSGDGGGSGNGGGNGG